MIFKSHLWDNDKNLFISFFFNVCETFTSFHKKLSVSYPEIWILEPGLKPSPKSDEIFEISDPKHTFHIFLNFSNPSQLFPSEAPDEIGSKIKFEIWNREPKKNNYDVLYDAFQFKIPKLVAIFLRPQIQSPPLYGCRPTAFLRLDEGRRSWWHIERRKIFSVKINVQLRTLDQFFVEFRSVFAVFS